MPHKDPEVRRAYERERRAQTRKRELEREYKISKRYGLTVEDYDAIMSQPCAICGAVATCLDHCHRTGRVRGPLCKHCNTGLGMFKDDKALLNRATVYLED